MWIRESYRFDNRGPSRLRVPLSAAIWPPGKPGNNKGGALAALPPFLYPVTECPAVRRWVGDRGSRSSSYVRDVCVHACS